jgi:hypothetical protein
MEDTGFLQPLYGEQSQKCEIRNLGEATAKLFAREMIERHGLADANTAEFLEKVVKFSAGNPRANIALIEMARHPKYRSQEHIKIAPLYVDYRLSGGIRT